MKKWKQTWKAWGRCYNKKKIWINRWIASAKFRCKLAEFVWMILWKVKIRSFRRANAPGLWNIFIILACRLGLWKGISRDNRGGSRKAAFFYSKRNIYVSSANLNTRCLLWLKIKSMILLIYWRRSNSLMLFLMYCQTRISRSACTF